jgi:hypothetical protein
MSFDLAGWLVVACLTVSAYLAYKIGSLTRQLLSVQMAVLILIQKEEERDRRRATKDV